MWTGHVVTWVLPPLHHGPFQEQEAGSPVWAPMPEKVQLMWVPLVASPAPRLL